MSTTTTNLSVSFRNCTWQPQQDPVDQALDMLCAGICVFIHADGKTDGRWQLECPSVETWGGYAFGRAATCRWYSEMWHKDESSIWVKLSDMTGQQMPVFAAVVYTPHQKSVQLDKFSAQGRFDSLTEMAAAAAEIGHVTRNPEAGLPLRGGAHAAAVPCHRQAHSIICL